MARFIARRLLLSLVTLWLLITIVFIIANVLPNDVGRTILGPFAQCEVCLVASLPGAGASDRQNVVNRKVGRRNKSRSSGEGAVSAGVPTQSGKRDEHLGRVGDPCSGCVVAAQSGRCHELGERCCHGDLWRVRLL